MAIKGSAKILVDTSAWIDFFRKKEPCHGIVDQLLTDDRICCTGLILAELMQGAKSERELSVIREFLAVFPFLPESTAVWDRVGALSYSLRKRGKSPGLSDCLIAVLALENKAPILTLDADFSVIKESLKIELVRI